MDVAAKLTSTGGMHPLVRQDADRLTRWLLIAALGSAPAWAQGQGTLFGIVRDAVTRQPISDVLIVASSGDSAGDQAVVTDEEGFYWMPQLPSGTYSLRFEQTGFRPYTQGGIRVLPETAIQVDVSLQPLELKAEQVVVTAGSSPIDPNEPFVQLNVGAEAMRYLPLSSPYGPNPPLRPFDSLSLILPGTQPSSRGVRIAGSTPEENRYAIDGLWVNDPATGLGGTPLAFELTDGLTARPFGHRLEDGRAAGGWLSAQTKSGSSEFHGSVWSHYSPGLLEGPRVKPSHLGSAVASSESLWNASDVGVDVSGPIFQDQLWFYVGIVPAFTRLSLTQDVVPLTGGQAVAPAADRLFADSSSVQYVAKLTWRIDQDQSLAVSVLGTPTLSGRKNGLAIDPLSGSAMPVVFGSPSLSGESSALSALTNTSATDVAITYQASFLDKHLLLDGSGGWHHQFWERVPSDGSAIGSSSGLAGTPQVRWRAPHSLLDFEPANPEILAACGAQNGSNPCPVGPYVTGGPGLLGRDIAERAQAQVSATYLLDALGHHLFKAGLDAEGLSLRRLRAYSGGVVYRESADGSSFQDYREIGTLIGPDQPAFDSTWSSSPKSLLWGAYAKDTWRVFDVVTLQVGIRYDAQYLWASDGSLAFALPKQVSPQVALVYDFTQQGRSKVYVSYAKLAQALPLGMADWGRGGQRFLSSYRRSAPAAGAPGCNPLDSSQLAAECRDPRNLIPIGASPADPNQYWLSYGGAPVVDPSLTGESWDEVTAGAEYDAFAGAKLGVALVHRTLGSSVLQLSRGEGMAPVLGNPGQGALSDLPVPSRDYRALSVYLDKAFSGLWLVQASYTLASLQGNDTGFFGSSIDPTFGAPSWDAATLANREGPLPSDLRHQIKVLAAKEIPLDGSTSLAAGVAYTGRSGDAISYLASHPIYGEGTVLLQPRGSAGRLPFVHDIDLRLSLEKRLDAMNLLSLSIEVYNAFNFQQVVQVDENYTFADSAPTSFGTVPPNPNFGKPVAYQPPRAIRFGARLSF